ncbi:MAG: right-handed parallel beta-helix repeat-containing protein [Methanobacteriota archaeon]
MIKRHLPRYFTILVCTVSFFSTIGYGGLSQNVENEFNIQEAINNAHQGDIIIVPNGTYPGGIDFLGKAITLKSQYGPKYCIIDGNEIQSGVRFNNSEGPRSVLQGFTITRCQAVNSKECGIYLGQYAAPTIRNCIVTGNTARSDSLEFEAAGAGVFCDRFSSPTLVECTISHNTLISAYNGYTEGAGLCSFYASPTLMRCWVVDNTVYAMGYGGGMGGGISGFYGGQITLQSCMIVNNTVTGVGSAYHMGGGLCVRYGTLALIQGCTFSGNHVVISGCPYQSFGGALYVGEGGDAWIRNTILWNNLWGDESQEIFISDPYTSTHVNINFSVIEGGEEGIIILNATYHEDILVYGTMNLVSDPLFRDPVRHDFHLTLNSPCVDAGEPFTWQAVSPTIYSAGKDIDGNPRFIDIPWIRYPGRGPLDIGADEVLLSNMG